MGVLSRLSSSQKHIQHAWHEFIASGDCVDNTPRQSILQAWQGCRDRAINPEQERAPTVYDNAQLEALLHKENLGLVGCRVLEKMTSIVEGTGHVMVLADAMGRMLYSVGHKTVQDELEKINFRPGGDWGESVVGPNGIGTPLALDRAEQISGSEHYCVGWKPWNCYGSPVHHPGNRSLLGCIDITGPVNEFQSQGMALVVSIAQTIEAELSLMHMRQSERLRQYFRVFLQQYSSDGLILIGACGQVLDYSSDIPDLLGLPQLYPDQLLFKKSFPSLWLTVEKVINEGNACEAEIATKNYPYLNNCSLIPVLSDADDSGVVVVIHKASLSSTCTDKFYRRDNAVQMQGVQEDLQSLKDDLIKQTLDKNKGNVSKTARALGINRSTIYRRMKRFSNSEQD